MTWGQAFGLALGVVVVVIAAVVIMAFGGKTGGMDG